MGVVGAVTAEELSVKPPALSAAIRAGKEPRRGLDSERSLTAPSLAAPSTCTGAATTGVIGAG